MNHRPVIFKVGVTLEGNRKTLDIGRFLQDYLDKECVEGETLDIVILHQRKYCEIVMDKKIEKSAPGGWECSCEKYHPRSEEKCYECGDVNLKGGEPYKNIREKFGNMREQP